MTLYSFPQYDGDVFWRYIDKLKSYLARCGDLGLERWEVIKIIYEGLNHETRANVESLCEGGLLSKTIDEVWCFFEWLVQETYEWESTMHLNIHSQPLFVKPSLEKFNFMNARLPLSIGVSCCHSSDHDTSYCPYNYTQWSPSNSNTEVVSRISVESNYTSYSTDQGFLGSHPYSDLHISPSYTNE